VLTKRNGYLAGSASAGEIMLIVTSLGEPSLLFRLMSYSARPGPSGKHL
jgi:hypothetical protein